VCVTSAIGVRAERVIFIGLGAQFVNGEFCYVSSKKKSEEEKSKVSDQ